MLLCACSKSEAYRVKNAVLEVDESAFLMFTETSEVFGEGFMGKKIYEKKAEVSEKDAFAF